MKDRRDILIELLSFSKPLKELKSMLSSIAWDSQESLVVVTRSHLINVLLRFLKNELNKNEVEDWANLIECREDLDYELDYTDLLAQAIYQLANPTLEGDLNIDNCKEMIKLLSGSNNLG